MQTSTDEGSNQGTLSFEREFLDFLAHDAKLDVLCRRMQCIRPGPDADERVKRLEDHADREIEMIAKIALRLSRMPAKDGGHVKIKAHILWSLIKEEEPESISEALLRSLCRDLIDP